MSAASLVVLRVQSTRLSDEIPPRQKFHIFIWKLIGFSPYHPLVCYSASHSAKHEDAVVQARASRLCFESRLPTRHLPRPSA